MRTVAHPGLPTVRSDLVDGDRYYMISDYVDGNDVHTLVAAHEHGGVPLPTVLSLVDQVADTLDHLHRHQPAVVHGDVKPENVMLAVDGRTVLIDFGAAMRVGDDLVRLGTPGFSAPEVLAGEELTPAADVYSLAALTVYLLTGIVPTLGTPWIAALNDAGLVRLERVIRRGLTWNPLGRPEQRDRLRQAPPRCSGDGPADRHRHPVAHRRQSVDARDAERTGSSRRAPCSSGLAPEATMRSSCSHAQAMLPPLHSTSPHPAMRRSRCMPATSADGTAPPCNSSPTSASNFSPALSSPGSSAPHRCGCCSAAMTRSRSKRCRTRSCESSVRRATRPAAGTDSAPSIQPAADRAAGWIASRVARSLAGRDDELETARAAVDAARSSGVAPLVIVTGEAGMGKTRLLAEFAQRAADSGDVVLVGRCTEMGGAFEPFLDALGDDFFAFDSGHLERDEEGWIDRRRFFGRIATALRALDRPVSLVIDDMQWIDGSSLALLTQLLDDVGPSLTIAAGCRPGSRRTGAGRAHVAARLGTGDRRTP